MVQVTVRVSVAAKSTLIAIVARVSARETLTDSEAVSLTVELTSRICNAASGPAPDPMPVKVTATVPAPSVVLLSPPPVALNVPSAGF